MINLEAEALRYRDEVQYFAQRHDLPKQWFERPDHLAVKAYTPADYKALIEYFTPYARRITEVFMDDRRIAAAHLLGQFSLDMQLSFNLAHGIVEWLEIMEARPDDQDESKAPLLDHEEIYFNGVAPMRVVLKRKGVPFFDQKNESHAWVSVIMDDTNDELKFTDRRLEDIVKEDLVTGRARLIHDADLQV